MTDWLHAHRGRFVQRPITFLTPPEWSRATLPPPPHAEAGNQSEQDQEPSHTSNDWPIILDPPDELRILLWRAAHRRRREQLPICVVFSAHTDVHEILVSLGEVICRCQKLDVRIGGGGGAINEVSVIYEDINVSHCMRKL